MKSSLRVVRLAACCWLLFSPILYAQESYDVQKGLTPYGSYKGGDLDGVNMANGNLTLHIPLISFPQRGKSLRLNYSIYANDKQYMFDYSPFDGSGVTGQWWLFGGPCPTGGYIGCGSGTFLAHVGAYVSSDQGDSGVQNLQTTFVGGCIKGGQQTTCTNLANNLYLLGPDDARHYFGSWAVDSGNYFNCGAVVDLSGWVVGPLGSNTTGCGGIIDRDGIVDGTMGLTDVDGNYIGSGDTVGRVFSTSSTSVSHCAAGTTSVQAWNVPGSSQPYYYCFTSLSYQTAFNATNYSHCFDLVGAAEASGSQLMLTQIVLPNSTSYQFSYDQYLSLTKVTLPTGGSISYTWQNLVLNCGNKSAPVSRALASRTKYDGVSSSTWHYQWISQSGGWLHVVTDPMGNDEVHHVDPTQGTDGEVDSYTGCSLVNTQYCSSGTALPLKIVQTSYQTTGNAGIMSAAEFGMFDVPVPATKTTILAGPGSQSSWKTSQTVYTMVPTAYTRTYYTFNADSSQPPTYGATAPLNSGQIASVAEYDFGAGAPGPLLRTTTTTYKWQDTVNGASYVAANLFNLPLKVVVTDGNGNKCSETDYTYDESAYLSPSGITFHHGTPPAGSMRGNATTTSHWLSSTPCQANATGTSIATHVNMYDTGEDYQNTDARSLTTTHSYSNAFYGAYRTQTQMPNTGSVQHSVSANYDLNSGLMTSFTGQNAGETTNYAYDFNMHRIASATPPTGGGETTLCYSDTGNAGGVNCSQTGPPYQVTMQTEQTSTTWITKIVLFDELGRSKQSQLASDPVSPDYTDTTYDADGRVATVSNPHRSAASSTDGITQTQYDGLGRVIFVTKQDGSIAQTEYIDACAVNTNAFATTVTDEAGKVRRTCTDALGRLTEVDEPGTGATDAIAGSGWVSINVSSPPPCDAHSNGHGGYYYTPDSGSVTITVGGTTVGTGWGGTCDSNGNQTIQTADQLSSALASALNSSAAGVKATDNGSGTVQITSQTPGVNTDYSLSSSSALTGGTSNPVSTSQSGSSLTGGSDPSLGSAPLVTLYTYDGLGNLLCAEQHGGVTGTGCSSNPSNDKTSAWRVRRFTYDSLSRLLTASNPETGTVTYQYDVDTNCASPDSFTGLLVSKADARGIRTCLQYDNLDRVTTKNYSNGDTMVTYSYDSGTSAIGHRTGMTDASGSTSWTYDLMGRTASETQTIAGHTKTISTLYNLDGSTQKTTYPSDSGSILNYGYDAAGHLTTLTDTAHSITYFQNTAYYPPGELNQATYGSVKETSIFNDRLQPCWFYATTGTALAATTLCTGTTSAANVVDLKYNFGLGAGDNGSLLGFTNDKDSNRSVTYQYDALNRITSAATPNTDCSLVPGTQLTKNWAETITVDAWGNLTDKTPTKCSAETLHVGPVTNLNQLPVSDGFGYDAAGNMTSNNGATYTYNAESQLKTAAGVTYTYDGDGNRAEKSSGTLYWGGTMLESDGSGNLQREFIFAAGKRIARRDISGGAVYYYFTDHLGSSSVVTNSSGVIQNESDFYPYGGERAYTTNLANQNYKFTGKERDTESGLDNFGARYDSSSLGRFMTPDWAARPTTVPYAVFGDPQSLNLYGYVRNDPVSQADADGHFGRDDYTSPVTGTEIFNDSQFGFNPEEQGQISDQEWFGQSQAALAQNQQKPAGLVAVNVEVMDTGNAYGIKEKVTYQIVDQNGNAMTGNGAKMEPQEHVEATINGQSVQGLPSGYADIGPSRVAGTSKNANAKGQFVDAPLGVTYPVPFGSVSHQQIRIKMGKQSFPVRYNRIVVSSNSPGHGQFSNQIGPIGGDLNEQH